MRANRANGIYFTIDQNDLNLNVDAYQIATSIPNPYVDLENDSGHAAREEAEVVSESTSFPCNGCTYNVHVYWSHWYLAGGLYWYYDPDGGTIEFVENLSTLGCGLCDKYDTHCCNANLFMNRSYPAKALTSSASDPTTAAVSSEVRDAADGEATSTTSGGSHAPDDDRSYSVNVTADGDIHLVADLDLGLAAYRKAALGLAHRTVAKGAAEGVVTFTRPLTWEELAQFEEMGVRVNEVELVSEPDASGLRWTFAATNDPTANAFVEEAAAEATVTVMGIVSANVTIPDAKVLNRLSFAEDVYLVDLSIADFELANPGVGAAQNDVYWILQGWD